MDVKQTFQDDLQDLSDIVYNHIKNAEFSVSLPMSFGDSYIKWPGRNLTNHSDILEALEEEFYSFTSKNLIGHEMVDPWSTGDLPAEKDDHTFKTPVGEFNLDDVYSGEFSSAVLTQILEELSSENKVIILPNDEWTDTDSYFDMTPDY